jgi:transcriptional regulator with XRE-family HTH domain
MSLRPSKTLGVAAVQDARRALGQRLRDLRIEAKMTGQQLAESLTWPPSKISKLENGRQTPNDVDIRGWTTATGREDEAEALLASLHTLELQHAEWQRVLKPGLKAHQTELAEQDQKTRFYRAFENTAIPGLLQTPDYARARFEQAVQMHAIPNDVDDAVKARMQRQEMLYRSDKRFHFILTESALRFRLCPPEVMLGQLDRVISFSALPTVKLGIIGFEADYPVDPRHGFWLLDEDLVRVETYSAELNLRQPQEIELYSKIFEQLAGPAVASYGRAARAIITRVIDELAADEPENGS